jgi:hypothetical protein
MTDVDDPSPYTPPTAETTMPAPSLGATGTARPWAPVEAIEFAWNAIRRGPLIVLLLVVAGIVSSIPDSIGAGIQSLLMLGNRRDLIVVAVVVRILFAIVGLGFNAWITLGKSRVKLGVCRGKEAQFAEIFSGGPFWSILGAYFVIALVAVVGLIVCVGPGAALLLIGKRETLGVIAVLLGGLVFAVPATVISWKIQFFPFLIVERGANAIQSIAMSWTLTDGQVFGLFVFWLLIFALVLAALVLGALACLVGLIVTLPTALTVVALAQTYIYLKLSGEEPVLKAS